MLIWLSQMWAKKRNYLHEHRPIKIQLSNTGNFILIWICLKGDLDNEANIMKLETANSITSKVIIRGNFSASLICRKNLGIIICLCKEIYNTKYLTGWFKNNIKRSFILADYKTSGGNRETRLLSLIWHYWFQWNKESLLNFIKIHAFIFQGLNTIKFHPTWALKRMLV